MAESSVLDKLLGFLKGFLSSMPSPIEGFSMNDVKVKEEGDVFSSLFSFSAGVNEDVEYTVGDDTITRTGQGLKDIGGNDIDVYILLRALNARDVFNPILSGLNQFNSLDDKEKAALYAAQTLRGAADMLLEFKNSETLKNAVCSKGGATIEGIKHLEKNDLHSITVGAVQAAYKRTLELT